MFKLSKVQNKILKQILILSVVVAALSILVAVTFSNSSYITKEGHFREQPISFSHQTHVDDVGLQCQFCHHQVNGSANADVPSMETCYGCHQEILNRSAYLLPVRKAYLTKRSIQWNRVYQVADHVHFNHSRHIKAGVSCTECHGDVHKMPLMATQKHFNMETCLQCHRTYHGTESAQDLQRSQLQDCYTCHR